MTSTGTSTSTNTLTVYDQLSGQAFLVDTGAEVSVTPAALADKLPAKKTSQLTAANGTTINSWGTRSLSLNLGKEHTYRHSFLIADVTRPILGADFFVNNGITIDLRNKSLSAPKKTPITMSSCDMNINLLGLAVVHSSPYTELLSKFPELVEENFDTPVKHHIQHHIETDCAPSFAKARRLSPEKLEAAKKEFSKLEKLGIVRRSNSPWSSPLHMVPKSDGSWRPCGDFRRLNAETKDDKYPIPNIMDFNNNTVGCKVFSKIDLIRGYHQIPMSPDSIAKTAVTTPFGLWEFTRSPFGLKNSGQHFQRLIDNIFQDIPYVFVYIDDILISSKNENEHMKHIEQVFKLLAQHGMIVNRSKCVFGVEQLTFLGHLITSEGILPLPERISAIRDIPSPKDRSELQRFLGLINFYHRFLPKIAQVLAPLHAQAGGKGQKIEWSTECQSAFQAAKQLLCEATLLHHPDPKLPTSTTVDASDTGIAGQLEQLHGRIWKPIAFFSRKLSNAEKNYSTFDRELLAAFNTIKHFKYFLDGRSFTLYTDHKPLTSAIQSKSDKSPRQTRHLSFISEFTTDIRHIQGKFNVVADTLSRIYAVDTPTTESTITGIDFVKLAQDQVPEVPFYQNNTSMKLENILFKDTNVLCDVSTGTARPIVPKSWTRTVFNAFHNLSHAGTKPTLRAISQRYVWYNMRREIRKLCKECHQCQSSKISLHTKSPLIHRLPPKGRFQSIHVDLVGPLPVSNNMTYILTIVDRFTRWPEALPLPDSVTTTCASALLLHWVARFGVPEDITSDRGPQFTSLLWQELHKLMGTSNNHTTAYHPQANGMVERLHRQLKAALMARTTDANWFDHLPFVLLGIRTSWRSDLDHSPAELVYGTSLQLPGEFVNPEQASDFQPSSEFVQRLQHTMNSHKPTVPTFHGPKQTYIPKDLSTSGFVYVRHDAHRKPLQRPYDGPYQIINTEDKYFTLDIKGKQQKVSLDRLKPAHIPLTVPIPTHKVRKVPEPDVATPDDTNDNTKEVTRQTRSGRSSRLPLRFRREVNAP